MPKATCSINDCERGTHARGWCVYHYNRWIRHGDPLAPVTGTNTRTFPDDPGAAFMVLRTSMVVESESGCWLWKGSITRKGYGRARWRGKYFQAHRLAYLLNGGHIPADYDLDHLCRVRACVNPAHLEPVTRRENLIRSTLPWADALKAETCIRGHAWTPENTRWRGDRPSSRRCLTCAREAKARYRRKKSAPL